MAFEPRIVRPDSDPDRDSDLPGRDGLLSGRADARCDELCLPSELQELASQLSADAEHLERCMQISPEQPASGSGRVRRLLSGVAAAAVIVGVGLWAAGRADREDALSADQAKVSARSSERLVHRVLSGGEQPLTQAAGAPVLLPDNLTSPEREGVLDLLEQQAGEPISLSI